MHSESERARARRALQADAKTSAVHSDDALVYSNLVTQRQQVATTLAQDVVASQARVQPITDALGAGKISPKPGLYALIERTKKKLAQREFQDVFTLNTQFHRYFIDGSQNPYARHVIGQISRLTLYARSSLKLMIQKNPAMTEDYVDHLALNQQRHEQIVQWVEKGDLDAAGDCMQDHLFETGIGMQELIGRNK